MKVGKATSVVARDVEGIITKKYGDIKPQEHFLIKDKEGIVCKMKGFADEDHIVFRDTDWGRAFEYMMMQDK